MAALLRRLYKFHCIISSSRQSAAVLKASSNNLAQFGRYLQTESNNGALVDNHQVIMLTKPIINCSLIRPCDIGSAWGDKENLTSCNNPYYQCDSVQRKQIKKRRKHKYKKRRKKNKFLRRRLKR
jgi:hypothetical protein